MIDRKEAVKIKVDYIGDGCVRINLRLRGQTKWLYFVGLYACEGDTITVLDHDSEDIYPAGAKFYSKPFEDDNA